MFAFVASGWMSRTGNGSQVGDGVVGRPAVLAGVGGLFSSFVEFMSTFVRSIGMTKAWDACKAVDR